MKNIIIILLSTFIFHSCDGQEREKQLTGYDIEIFDNTPALSIAQAIKNEDTAKIKKLLKKHPKLLNFREPIYGFSLIYFAVFNEKYDAVKILVELGADVNLPDFEGNTAFMRAANKDDPRYLKLLLQYGGNVNYVNTSQNPTFPGATPLIAAIHKLENVKLLVEAGADINYVNDDTTALEVGIITNAVNNAAMHSPIEVLRYLIIEKGANYKLPYYKRDNGKVEYIIDALKELYIPEEAVEDEKIRQELIKFIENGG